MELAFRYDAGADLECWTGRLNSHVETCVADAIASGRPKDRKGKIAELMEVFSKFAHIGGR